MFALSGLGRLSHTLGDSWAGHPSIHLISFRGQPKDAAAAISKFGADVAQIMNRVEEVTASEQHVQAVLGRNMRAFNDYAVLINEAVTVWVYSKEALSAQIVGEPDPNWGHLVSDKQIQAEFVDYLHAAHLQLEQRLAMPYRTLQQVAEDRQVLTRLERSPKEVTSFGELRNLFDSAQSMRNLPELRDRVREGLREKGILLSALQDSLARRFGWLLASLLGMIGISALATSVVLPLWRWADWWLPQSLDASRLFSVGIAASVVLAAVLIIWKLTAGRAPGV